MGELLRHGAAAAPQEGRPSLREWKDGKPSLARQRKRSQPRIVKVVRLESYEDALNNLETRRTDAQQRLLDAAEAQGADGLKEQYLLRYMLDVETRGSQSLLNVQAFTDPTAYKLKVKRPGRDESREVNVDLLETFNWLIGLTVQHIAAPQTLQRRVRARQREAAAAEGPAQAGCRRAVVVPHRHRHHARRPQDAGHLAQAHRRSGAGQPGARRVVHQAGLLDQGREFDLIYVNGDNNLENLKAPDDTWKVRLIEEDFHRLMFDTEGCDGPTDVEAPEGRRRRSHRKLVLNQLQLQAGSEPVAASLFDVKRFERLA